MEDQLISFETAKLAKEKGFDIPVEYGGFNSKMRLTRQISMYKIQLTNWNKNHTISGKPSFSVPTQSLLQKWLREEHNIHCWLIPAEIDKAYRCYIWSGIKLNLLESINTSSFKTYEEALEKGLQEALKLIKV